MHRLSDKHFDIAYVTNTTYGFYLSIPFPFELTQNAEVLLTQDIFCCPIWQNFHNPKGNTPVDFQLNTTSIFHLRLTPSCKKLQRCHGYS